MISHSYYQTCTICEVREERLSTICQVSQELRQRNVGGSNGDGGDDLVSEVMKQEVEVEVEVNSRPNLSNGKLENANSLDWKRFMAEDPNCK